MSLRIKTFDNISLPGLKRFPRAQYEVSSDSATPDAILLRSHELLPEEIPESVVAVARAGAGVNNIPTDELSQRGIPVFNAPGANANAVKEIVVAGLLLGFRNIRPACDFVRALPPDGLSQALERGKKKFVGHELPGRTLGVIGLGAIGVEVANTALMLGMKVVGYDPQLTVRRAWQLSSGVMQAESLNELLRQSDAVTVHVPLLEQTQGLINAERLAQLPPSATLLNFSRGPIVNETAVLAALDEHRLHAYVCDFPTPNLAAHPRVTALPHLGASTVEAEENCAIMVAENLKEFLEQGNIRHSVNFPEAVMPKGDTVRLSIANANVPNMVGQISTALAKANLNIVDMLNKSRGELAYTLVDVDQPVPASTVQELKQIDGVLRLRIMDKETS